MTYLYRLLVWTLCHFLVKVLSIIECSHICKYVFYKICLFFDAESGHILIMPRSKVMTEYIKCI